ncbi:MAG: EAL domain-containing response regulator [Pseudomonadota bacterium]|nr:EAL domain-containing response regulator [Pseudomonadota bacterium]
MKKASELNILVVEDDSFQRRLVVNMLRSVGVIEICDAENGRQALELIHVVGAKTVDIAICDMNMPEMDGLEFLRHLGQEKTATSIIILSTLDSKLLASVAKMSLAYGIHLLGVIEKPISVAQLQLLISQYTTTDVKSQHVETKVATPVFSLEEILIGVRAKQFEPFFQPKVDLKTGRVSGAEALARWLHPEHGVIAPYAFIDLLEQGKQIDELTFLMLEKAAAASRLLDDKGYTMTISVNLSLTSLSDITLAKKITQVVRDAGVDPAQIILEVTESAAMTDVAPALENLARLRMHGFGLSIDDYGTGYSSMQQLTRVAFSELKIDQSFVKDIATNQALRIIVESSIDMARKLGVKSIAEGVETQEDWDTLKSMGCNMAQGYFIAKPMSLYSFIEFCEG